MVLEMIEEASDGLVVSQKSIALNSRSIAEVVIEHPSEPFALRTGPHGLICSGGSMILPPSP
jgi:hypothetical protein